jgi:hypothetical protein
MVIVWCSDVPWRLRIAGYIHVVLMQGCTYFVHHPGCGRRLLLNIHSPDQPWGKLDSRAQALKVADDVRIHIRCLKAGCAGRLVTLELEKEKGVKGQTEEWYHAKWHRDELEEKEREAREKEEAKEAAKREAEAAKQADQEQAAKLEAEKKVAQAKRDKEAKRRAA